jgi:hypothetical protein
MNSISDSATNLVFNIILTVIGYLLYKKGLITKEAMSTVTSVI